MRINHAAVGLVVSCGLSSSLAHAAWVPPGGFSRVPGDISGNAIAVAPDGKVAVGYNQVGATPGSIKVFADAAAASVGASPIRTYTDPAYVSFGDLTFNGNDNLLFSEFNAGNVFSGTVSTGAVTPLAANNSVPFPQGVAVRAGTVYATSVIGPGASDIYALSGGTATPVVSNIGVGYIGGLAFDLLGNMLVTDSNDPSFSGAPGRVLRYSPAFAPLAPIDLNDGPGAGVRAYDLAIDTEGDIFVSTGPTLTRVSSDLSSVAQFGPTFTGGFEFVASLDFVGGGFEPNAGSGRLFVQATDTDEQAIFAVTPIPEPGSIGAIVLAAGALALTRKRRTRAAPLAAVAVLSMLSITPPTRGDQFYATEVIARTIGTQQQPAFTDPSYALGPPRGGGIYTNSLDVYCLGNGGSITLGFNDGVNQRGIFNGPGYDFIVSENAFLRDEDEHASFAELLRVEVSTDGINFARFPAYSATLSAVGPFGVLDPDKVDYFAGITPVLANVDENTIDPFDASQAGGDAFDLCWLGGDPFVQSGVVDVNHIKYVRLIDVIGDGTSWDVVGRPVFDPTGIGIGGADVDSVAVINGTHMPEPFGLLSLCGTTLLLRRRR